PNNQVTQLVTTQDPGTQTDNTPVVTQSGGGGTSGGGNQGNQGNKKDNKNQQAGLKPLPPNAYPMAAIGDKNFTGVPPLNEIRFISNELVMQSTADQATMEGIFRQFRLTLLSAQRNELTGRTVYRVRTEGPVRDQVIAIEQAKLTVPIITTPNYAFMTVQDPNAAAGGAGQGDASQYIVDKRHLTEAHRLSKGNGVLIAVIDSQVDERHPELDGEIAERFDSLGSTPTPHPHGTGMAGAIVSHQRLLGIAPGA